MNIYEQCPILEDERYKLRLIEEKDSEDLLYVYSDKHALPFFNSDNCNGSNFYCKTKEEMDETIKYWLLEYHEYKGFVRFSIIDKQQEKIIGTIEMFNRKSEDYYNNCGVLRLDVGSDYEKSDVIYNTLSLCMDSFYNWFQCSHITTKAALYAVERIEALKKMNFIKSEKPLIGQHQKLAYNDYWIRHKL